MTNQTTPSERLITAARKAIEADRPDEARPLLREAAHRAPDDPRPWLLMAGIAGTPRERRAYLAQARRLDAKTASPVAVATRAQPATVNRRPRRLWVGLALVVLLLMAGAVIFHPAGRELLGNVVGRVSALSGAAAVAPTPAVMTGIEPSEEPVAISPTAVVEAIVLSPTSPPVFPTKEALPGGGPLPTWTPTSLPTPTLAPTMTPSPTPEPSATPEPIPLSSGAGAPRPASVGPGERWINVNLSTQTLVAYEGDTPVYETLVSSGLPQWPTVTGEYRTYMKYESQTMNGYLLGYDYFLPDVPYVMYFYEDYAIHGTYWHSNFGTPMSHGCVNVSTPDAGWLFNWAPVGTLVNVHY